MKFTTIITEITIKVSLEKTWDVLYTHFGDVSLFNPNLSGSHFTNSPIVAIGSERECRINKKTYVYERITGADPLKNVTIEVTGGNMSLIKTMQVEIHLFKPSPGYTTVTTIARFTIQPRVLRFLMRRVYKSKLTDMLIGLKYYLETGTSVTKNTYHLIFQNHQLLGASESFQDIQISKNSLCSDCSICCHCQK
ncbi:MAG: hypothetical protein PHD73_00770 [Sediminibacterium sp.]|nr:hypothetical protein [Sediminibacterium sp.]